MTTKLAFMLPLDQLVWQFTINLYLALNISLYVSVDDFYPYERWLNISNKYLSNYVCIPLMHYEGL